MKHITTDFKLNAPFARESQKTVDEGVEHIVNELFARFWGIFPSLRHSLKTTEQLNHTKREWVIAFMDNGINTQEQLEAGLKQCRLAKPEFLPTIGQFIEWANSKPAPIVPVFSALAHMAGVERNQDLRKMAIAECFKILGKK